MLLPLMLPGGKPAHSRQVASVWPLDPMWVMALD
jgi:hypothetical protein